MHVPIGDPSAMTFSGFLKLLLEGRPLAEGEARDAMGLIMDGQATPGQIGAFLAALRVRGETVGELVGFAKAMRYRAAKVAVKRKPLLDTCGTGGDASGTFNVSTTVAFVAAGAGAAVAKHGNRSVSSKCGSADVLEALAVKTEISPKLMARCVEEAGIGFLFAPALHPAMRHAAPVRRELAARTVFNLLGPLSNPAGASRQLLGVYSTTLVRTVAEALAALGSERAFVVASRDGLDELSLNARSVVCEVRAGKIRSYEVDPRKLGLKPAKKGALEGGDAKKNARIVRAVLSGELGAPRDIVLLNCAAALVAAGVAADLKEGLAAAADSIDSGRAFAALGLLARLSHAG
jgi:anthranilate phosphoribosyltransferase